MITRKEIINTNDLFPHIAQYPDRCQVFSHPRNGKQTSTAYAQPT